jgi:hypothetical protein
MSTLQTMKQALEALEATNKEGIPFFHSSVIDNFRAAIAEQEKAEPVAFYYKYLNCFNDDVWTTDPCWDGRTPLDSVPLYTHPAPVPAGMVAVNEELDLLDALLKGWIPSIATSEGFRAVRSIRKLLTAAPKPGDNHGN